MSKGSDRLHARQQCKDEVMQSNWDKAFTKEPKTEETPVWQDDPKIPEFLKRQAS